MYANPISTNANFYLLNEEGTYISLKDIDVNMFSSMLYTNEIPDPDLLIRTSGEQRISNYLLWQLAYTELAFTQTAWPDFNKEEFLSILQNYSQRERRYGKL